MALAGYVAVDLRLPDGRHVLQQRDSNAEHSPGQIACFGGGLDRTDFCPFGGIERELLEELGTSPKNLRHATTAFYLSELMHSPIMRFHMYVADLDNMPEQVLEGSGVVAMRTDEVLGNPIVARSTEFIVRATSSHWYETV